MIFVLYSSIETRPDAGLVNRKEFGATPAKEECNKVGNYKYECLGAAPREDVMRKGTGEEGMIINVILVYIEEIIALMIAHTHRLFPKVLPIPHANTSLT